MDLFDRTPDVDDLHTALRKLFCFLRKVKRNTGGCRGVRLIDVNPLDRATKGRI